MSEKETIRKLKEENRKLKRENAYLRQRTIPDGKGAEMLSSSERNFRKSARIVLSMDAKTYFGYLVERFRHSRLFLLYDKTRFAVRGFFFARKIWQLLIFFSAFLGIGAQFLLVAGALAVFLPAALIFSFLIGIYGYFVQKKWKKYFRLMFQKEKMAKVSFVFLPQKGNCRYFFRFLSDMAKDGAVFLVSHSFRECGFSGISKREENIYQIHISFYFSFEKTWESMNIVKIYL